MEIGRSNPRQNPVQRGMTPRAEVKAPTKNTVQALTPDTFERAPKAGRAQVAAAPAPTPFTLPSKGVWSTDSKTGVVADPVTMYVHGSLEDVEATLTKAGWTKADPQGAASSLKYVGAAVKQEALTAIHWAAEKLHGVEIGLAGVFGIHLPEVDCPPPHVDGVDRMPVSAQSVGGKPFVSAWEFGNNPLGGRDHVRIFDTGTRDEKGLPVYGISPILDTGIRFAPDHPESGFMFHTVAPDAAPERDKFLGLLQKFGNVTELKTRTLPFGGPSGLGEQVLDSKVYELTLGAAKKVAPRLTA